MDEFDEMNQQANENEAAESAAQPEAPVESTPAPETSAHVDGTYSGVGVGRRETVGENAYRYTSTANPQPNSGWQNPNPQPSYQTAPQNTAAPKAPKAGKKKGHGKAVIAACLAGAMVGGLGGGTLSYFLLNNNWENKAEALTQSYQEQLDAAVSQIENKSNSSNTNQAVTGTQTSVSTTGELTPSQVYQNNVNAVVYIENQGVQVVNYYGYSQESEFTGSGSGFVISEDGYILTNYHVVADYKTLTVVMYNGDSYDATLVGYDSYNDVALLKVDAAGLPCVTIGNSDAANVGEQVVAIGNPLGELTSTLTAGYISAKDRQVNTDGTIINMLQTDAAINSGNSGGPLFNMKGDVIGITSAKYSGSSSSGATIEGIGFAIPINDVMDMIEDLKEYGYVRGQAYLGVSINKQYTNVGGALVSSVTEGSCAETAGVQAGDIITALGDTPVSGYSELALALRGFKAGDTTTITVLRNGRTVDLTITLDEKQNTTVTEPTEDEVPDEGSSYEEWYEYFEKYFGKG